MWWHFLVHFISVLSMEGVWPVFGCIIKGLTKDLAKKHLSIERR